MSFSAIVKYGEEGVPVTTASSLLQDDTVTVNGAGFKTTSTRVNERLSDDYINQRIAEGKGAYISPDRQIDASTSILKDHIWFMKGVNHDNFGTWSVSGSFVGDLDREIFYNAAKGKDFNVRSDARYPQFMVKTGVKEGGQVNVDDIIVPMTVENCEINHYVTGEEAPQNRVSFVVRIFRAIENAFKALFSFLKNIFKK